MDTKTAPVAKNIQNLTVAEIKKDALIRMDAIRLDNNKGVGFPAIKNDVGARSLLVFIVPATISLIEGARYDVRVKRVTVSPKKTKGGYQLIFALIEIVRLIEYTNRFYNPEKYIIYEQRKSGKVILGKVKEIFVQKKEIFYKSEDGSIVYTTYEYVASDGRVVKRDILKGETRRCWRRKHKEEDVDTILGQMLTCPEPI